MAEQMFLDHIDMIAVVGVVTFSGQVSDGKWKRFRKTEENVEEICPKKCFHFLSAALFSPFSACYYNIAFKVFFQTHFCFSEGKHDMFVLILVSRELLVEK